MEGPEKLDGLQVSPAPVPKFQAYLRQRLVFEHQRRRLQRSQRTWMCVAIVALGLVGFGLAQPRPFIRAHYALFTTQAMGSGPDFALVESGAPSGELLTAGSPLARTVAASLQRDSELAARLGGRGVRQASLAPEVAYVVSSFPLPDGREVRVYTSLLPERDEVVGDVLPTSEGGTW